ncbi:MAG: indole-3-glycerol-phosphate synthase [Thermoproteota archaeon]
MTDYLDILAKDTAKTIRQGYYEDIIPVKPVETSLKEEILKCNGNPVISEIKFASPSQGRLREDRNPKRVAKEMEEGGAIGISVLTEPRHFQGKIEFIPQIRGEIEIPILMKDLFLTFSQIDAAHEIGANAILMIQALFQRGYCQEGITEMIDYAHSRRLEVLLEVHTEEEFLSACEEETDMIGVNNRDLGTLDVNLEVTEDILTSHPPEDKIIVSESGIKDPRDIRLLRRCGAQAFLVGTSIMNSKDITAKVKELVETL